MFRSKYITPNKSKDEKVNNSTDLKTSTPMTKPIVPNQQRTDEKGFPKSKCSGILSLISGDCLADGDKVSVIDATKDATSNIGNAIIHFGITTGAVGVNKILDVLSLTLLGLDDLSMNNREEIIKKLEEKMLVLQHLATDEKSKAVLRKLFASLATIVMEGMEEARVPLIRSIESLNSVTVNGLNSLMRSGSKFLKNAIKILPVVGDAYIILDNALVVAAAGTKAGSVVARNAENVVSTADNIVRRVQNRVEPSVGEFNKNVEELNQIRNDIENLSVSGVAENVESSIGKSIKNMGNSAANVIRRFTPKLRGGSGKLKSSLKRVKKTHNKTKRVRFNV